MISCALCPDVIRPLKPPHSVRKHNPLTFAARWKVLARLDMSVMMASDFFLYGAVYGLGISVMCCGS